MAARGKIQVTAGNGSGVSGVAAEGQDEIVMRAVDDKEPLAIYVYKTMTDPFTGRVNFFKVISGKMKTDTTVMNYTRQETESLTHLYIMQGRKPVEVQELHAGDLGAAVKLRVTLTGDTLGDKAHEMFIEPVSMPEPAMTYAIEPKTRGDEDKLAPALHKLMEEDPMLRFYRDLQTNEFLVAGAGQPHIEALVSKLKRRYHTNVILHEPKVPYRETVRGRAEAQGRHKKQSGGHGQFGDCKLRIEPQPRGTGVVVWQRDLRWIDSSAVCSCGGEGRARVGGARVPCGLSGGGHQGDGVRRQLPRCGFERDGVQDRGAPGFRKCMEQAKPSLLEPMMKMEIEAPDDFAGALMGDLTGRRGGCRGWRAEARGRLFARRCRCRRS